MHEAKGNTGKQRLKVITPKQPQTRSPDKKKVQYLTTSSKHRSITFSVLCIPISEFSAKFIGNGYLNCIMLNRVLCFF